MGTAEVQRKLWGPRARDWATYQEHTLLPVYQAVLGKTGLGPGMTLLDVGCGAGKFCEMAARVGARVTGLDATQPLLDIAQERVPDGRFVQGEMEDLPFDSHSFDVVTGSNSFQYAANPVRALQEARRVAKRGIPVVIVIWGRQEDCEAAGHLFAVGKLLPPPPPGAPGPFALSERGALQALARDAGLTPGEEGDVDCPWSYPDAATALRALLSAGPAVRAINHAGEEAVRSAIAESIAPYRTATGGYLLRNRFRYLITSA